MTFSRQSTFSAFLLLICFSFINPQSTYLGLQPYFRIFLSPLPFSNSNGEFQASPQDTERPVVTIPDGKMQGTTLRTVHGRKVSAFQSIPFAEPPVGPLRFGDPVKVKPWTGTLNAMRQMPICIQLLFGGQEDCLYLSVYVPQDVKTQSHNGLPVMIFIHGGAFMIGSGSAYGPRYLLDRDIIFVTINYRLGPFGFLTTGDLASPGNQGLKDQTMALQWVQQNIAYFGGDPNSVTIFGQSSGAGSVGLHIVSPLSRGLFHRGIQQSGSSLCFWALQYNGVNVTRKVAEIYKCSGKTSQEIVECLRKVPASLLVLAPIPLFQWFTFPLFQFTPTIEPEHPGAFITKTPEQYYENKEAANVTLINGLTRDEQSWFVSSLMLVATGVKDINTHWDWVGPNMLEMDFNGTEVNTQKAREIWKFYMGNEPLSWKTRHQFAKLFSDRYQTECCLEAMRYHSMYTKQSVYGYQFNYQGRFSGVQQFAGRPEDFGVGHLDDLIYLMNGPDYYQTLKRGDPELEMSYLMTSIWANFATYNKPLIPDGNTTKDVWQPIEPATDRFSPLRFLDLSLKPKMIDDPWVDRYKFWRNINPYP